MPDTVPGSGGQVEMGEYMEFRLRYSLFHREIKRYDKETFEEIKRR